MIRCSLGTAQVLGLKQVKVDDQPTTAYLMIGERCTFNCAFCAQARESSARADLLSRVSWPAYKEEEVTGAFQDPAAQVLRRVCFQVVQEREALAGAKQWVKEIQKHSSLPICVSAGPGSLAEVGELIRLGVDHVSIALDAATPEVYHRMKDGSWARRHALLRESAAEYPGHIATHLIVGLGESEEDMVERIREMQDLGITVALFAFTPVRGTRLEAAKPPDMGQYRRVQAAHYLLRKHLAQAPDFHFEAGKLRDFGLPETQLKAYLEDGEAFRTSGCEGCNRPYYNEVPGEELYNYPRPLTEGERERAWQHICGSV